MNNDLIEALQYICFYNGHNEKITELINYIQENKNGTISCPEHILTEDADNFINIIWQILVVVYGDYGSSPRWAWINSENKQKAIMLLKQINDEDGILFGII